LSYTWPAAQTTFSLQDLLRRWHALLLNPSVAAFDRQRGSANWPTVWYSLLGLALVQSIVALFQRAESLYWNSLVSSSQVDQFLRDFGMRNINPLNPGIGALLAFVNAFLGFFVMAGLVYLFARMLGGVGSFLEHSYLIALVYVPLQLIASVAGLIPMLGGLVGAAAIIYMVMLIVMAICATHRLNTGTAIVAAILPALLAGLLVVMLAVVVAMLIAGTILNFNPAGMLR